MKRAAGTWVITGAGSGFGRVFAQRLAERGETLALWDRDAAGLETTRALLGSARVHVQSVDVTDAAAVWHAAESTRDAIGPVAHVVNSAGILRVGKVEELGAEEHARMMQVNYLGSVHVAQALLPQLKSARGRSTLLFVASVAGLRGFPELAGYCASKFAVVGFAQALRAELDGTDVDVRALCPPPGDTPMVRDLAKVPPIYKLSRLYSAEEVVDATLKNLDRRGFVLLVDAYSKLLHKVGAVAPGVVDRIIRFAAR
ncbi:MAG: SDR family NAD(P)-dependent oxidoreductase [Sandaracinus sp.]|nr:SDR family NAD(P)-dependent oxidoreductase [Myxococcales bacterium]MCB9600340.1 SDR family NAD(P)-dependent oxidoreductase [Sandaracinus sp.]MCB9617191.1 SDR family NAD(P)-dependent oxidoreductase [Sandaracinus sp.]MCB9620208.1 SDR family NAD(P)-dependent oxidoreductase [Sandaracinus sp.]MCB9632792.1 SDR family NAD(P)-dependent oxidoreductase [Sandaracinus sp.]